MEGDKLTKDLFRKPTDASRYLEFSSFHPRHTFRSIVYSQALRYRRIVNDDYILKLSWFIERLSYPVDIIKEVISDVRSKPRLLDYRSKNENPAVFTPWIITFGAGYRETKEKATEVNDTISNSCTWSNTSPAKIPTLQVVTRRTTCHLGVTPGFPYTLVPLL